VFAPKQQPDKKEEKIEDKNKPGKQEQANINNTNINEQTNTFRDFLLNLVKKMTDNWEKEVEEVPENLLSGV
jgi:hypothetical protein